MIKIIYKRLNDNNRKKFNSFIIQLIRWKLLPMKLLPLGFRNFISGEMVFNFKTKLVEDKRGFYYISPKFSEEQLDEYYKNTYWGEFRSDVKIYINERDLVHYNLILRYYSDFFSKEERTIVNFGSGHGGISILFYFLGHTVINIDPDTNVKNNLEFDPERWKKIESITKLNQPFDLFYSSHSLEHVHDIDVFLDRLNQKISLNKKTILFFEVPDGEHPLNGGKSGKILTPHTYYYTPDFFKWLPFKTILIEKDYRVLRYLGEKNKD